MSLVNEPQNVTGCIVRMWCSERGVLDEIADRFKEYGQAEVLRGNGMLGGNSAYILYHERIGNLDLFGWFNQIAASMEEHIPPPIGVSSLRIGIELVY